MAERVVIWKLGREGGHLRKSGREGSHLQNQQRGWSFEKIQ